MQATEVAWYRWLAAMIVVGIGTALFLWLGFYLPNLPGRPPAKELPREVFPRGIEVTPRGVPQVLVWFYVLMGVFILAYTLYTWWAKVNY